MVDVDMIVIFMSVLDSQGSWFARRISLDIIRFRLSLTYNSFYCLFNTSICTLSSQSLTITVNSLKQNMFKVEALNIISVIFLNCAGMLGPV